MLCGWYIANAYPNANRTLILRTVSRINAHLSSSSITILFRRPTIGGGVGIGVGGTLSKADEKTANNDDEECARLRVANDKRD
jgi:hypothetical protein